MHSDTSSNENTGCKGSSGKEWEMDLCPLKNSELEPHYQKYKGRVVLRGDIVKDDSGSYAEVMDIISRQPGCSGQAADAVSAYTQVRMEDAPTLFKKNPKSECPNIWIRLPEHKWPKLWSSMEDPVVLLERNLYGHPFAGQMWERQFEEVLLQHGWEKVPNWECLVVNREKGTILVCMWTIQVFVKTLFVSDSV